MENIAEVQRQTETIESSPVGLLPQSTDETTKIEQPPTTSLVQSLLLEQAAETEDKKKKKKKKGKTGRLKELVNIFFHTTKSIILNFLYRNV
jgi:hypothetical protein